MQFAEKKAKFGCVIAQKMGDEKSQKEDSGEAFAAFPEFSVFACDLARRNFGEKVRGAPDTAVYAAHLHGM